MAIVSEVEDRIYEIKPVGKGLDCFPLCTTYLVVDDKIALIETGCPVQVPDILEALGKLGYNAQEVSYIIPTHVHSDHAGGAGKLVQQMPEAQVVGHPRSAKFLADPSMITRLMQGFKKTFGNDAEERFGIMLPIPLDKFILVDDGESIQLGGRELKVINTSGHAPYHLSFIDSKTRGLFCGDAFGGYFSELKVILPSSAPGSDPILTIQSMEKLQGLNPELVFFSHGSATREATKIIRLGVDQARKCKEIALEMLKTLEDKKEIAHRIIEVLAMGSGLSKSELSNWPYLIPVTVDGYWQYFKKIT